MSKYIQIVTAILVVLGMMAFMSCRCELNPSSSSQNQIHKDISVKPFDEISVNGSMNVYYEQGATRSVKLVCNADDAKRMDISSDGKTLNISYRHTVVFGIERLDRINVYVSSPDLVNVHLSGSGEFYSKKHVDTDNIGISLAGSGTIEFSDLICDNLSTSLVGSGDIGVDKVICASATLSCTGSGDLDANIFKANKVNISLQGSGDVSVKVKDCNNLVSSLAGSGDITLLGNVKTFDKNLIGSGDFNTDNLHVEK